MSRYYLIDELIEIFEKHSEIIEDRMKKDREKYPDSEWTKDDFIFPAALLSICKEIQELKNNEK